ncbi:MAG: decarboxylating NADP(+)-dependent phosphogluconate dehydrogenase, partial [Acholeplasmataceae bacterium]
IGVIGLAVMGENLVLNIESKGFRVSAFARRNEVVEAFLNGRAKGKAIFGTSSLPEFVDSLEKPRKVMLLIKAGKPVDDVIDQLIPLLEEGDIIIDGGNSHYADSARRTAYVESKGLLYVGTGVSGGEEGALRGPSIMPGGSKKAWPEVKPIFQAIAARTADGAICADWIGRGGAGHFVKMVHNGIEYGDIQLIAETYHLMRDMLNLTPDEMHEVFKAWNRTELDSYLIEITKDIMAAKDQDGSPLIDRILDTAGQKGTGKWTAIASIDEDVPLTLITEAVYARFLSAMKEERKVASRAFKPRPVVFDGDREAFLEDMRKALYAAKIISYAQGFALMKAASDRHDWDLDYGAIAMLWRAGCIIRSAFLDRINQAYELDPELGNLMLDPYFKNTLEALLPSWRNVLAEAIRNGIPVPSMSAALAYFDGYRTERLPANLLQAQRDYFGAHMYERVDAPRGEFFHTNWTGRGGDTSSTTYKG